MTISAYSIAFGQFGQQSRNRLDGSCIRYIEFFLFTFSVIKLHSPWWMKYSTVYARLILGLFHNVSKSFMDHVISSFTHGSKMFSVCSISFFPKNASAKFAVWGGSPVCSFVKLSNWFQQLALGTSVSNIYFHDRDELLMSQSKGAL